MALRPCALLALVVLGACVDLTRPPLVKLDPPEAAADERSDAPDGAGAPDGPGAADGPGATDGQIPEPDANEPDGRPSADALVPDAAATDQAASADAPPPPPDAPPADSAPDSGCTSESQCTGGYSCIDNLCAALPGLALHWKLDETSGTRADDASGNGFHGTYGGSTGSPASSSSAPVLQYPNPASRTFVGSNRQEVRLGSLPAVLQRDNDVTLSAWFRATQVTDSMGYADVVSVGDGYILYVGRMNLGFIKRLVGRNYVFCSLSTTAHLDGRWHHMAGVTDSSGMKFFLDGTERCFVAQGGSITYAAAPVVLVGHDPDPAYGWYFDGNIDDVRAYTRVLSVAEIGKLAAGGR